MYQAKFMNKLYPDAVDDLPLNAPNPKGRAVQISCFIDADHIEYQITQRSKTGILIFLNKDPFMWYSKHQNMVETYTFGSDLVAMKQAVKMLEGLKYKLWMFGI